MLQPNIGFIGAGNMARSLIGGLIKNTTKGLNILACDTSADQLALLEKSLDYPSCLSVSTDNAAIAESDIIVLAVKPQIMQSVATGIEPHIKPGSLVISIAAGISVQSLEHWLGTIAIVRAMPNTPALIQKGATGLYANAKVSEEQKSATDTILSAVGITCWVESEPLIDAVTAVSGSGPAYFFLFTELIAQAGKDMGLDNSVAETLAKQTCLGAGLLASESQDSLTTLREKVTSPGGTTEQAINRFISDDLKSLVKNAMQDCADRAETMSKEFGA